MTCYIPLGPTVRISATQYTTLENNNNTLSIAPQEDGTRNVPPAVPLRKVWKIGTQFKTMLGERQ